MSRSMVLTIHSIVTLLFGIGFVLVPAQVLAPYGLATDAAGIGMSRLFGAALIGFGVLYWLARDTHESEALKAVLLASAVGMGLGALVALYLMFSTPINALGWTTVAIYVIFAVAHYVLWRQAEETG